MGGWNSGTFDETSPVGKDWVNLECGVARVFVKAGRRAGKATLSWRYEGFGGVAGEQSGTVALEAKAVASKDGFLATPPQSFVPNRRTFERKTDAQAIQDLHGGGVRAAERYKVFVNGAEVEFPNGLGAPVKPDDNTGVCCAYAPVLAALVKAGASFEYIEEPKRIPANKKWLRKLSPSPFRPMVTVKAGGREIDACAGFTELFIDNGKDKNLTNCEIYSVGKKNAAVVCGELAALVGYIPGIEIKTDAAGKSVFIKTKGPLK